jgi:6-phosphogluconolactonase
MPGNLDTSDLIRIYSDHESLSSGAAGLFVLQAEQARKARGRFTVVLSGGQTPHRTYELLAGPPFRDQVAWSQTHVFWGDERCVPLDDPRSNAGTARRILLERVPIPSGQIHPLSGVQSPREDARRYEDLMRSFFGGGPPRFDLVFLGLGEDGHTASLFPYAPVLREKTRWAAEVPRPQPDLRRVTLTPFAINQAVSVAFLVAGLSKAPILKEVLEGHKDPLRLPAQLISPSEGKVEWLVDREAASQLRRAARREDEEQPPPRQKAREGQSSRIHRAAGSGKGSRTEER